MGSFLSRKSSAIWATSSTALSSQMWTSSRASPRPRRPSVLCTTAFSPTRESVSKTKAGGYAVLVLTILLHGSECWSLREDLYDRLRVFHNRCLRTLCRVKMRQVHRHRIKQDTLNARVGLQSLDYYYSTRLLRWAGHVSRMPWYRTPRKLLTSWVRHKRPVGAPSMTFGRTLNKALKSAGISTLAAT